MDAAGRAHIHTGCARASVQYVQDGNWMKCGTSGERAWRVLCSRGAQIRHSVQLTGVQCTAARASGWLCKRGCIVIEAAHDRFERSKAHDSMCTCLQLRAVLRALCR